MIDTAPLPGVPSAAELMSAQEARRERRAKRKNLRLVDPSAEPPAAEDGIPATPAKNTVETPPREVAPTQKLVEAEMRRMSRETRMYPDSSHRADRQARNATREPGEETPPAEHAEAVVAESVATRDTDPSAAPAQEASGPAGKAARRRANTAEKARRRNGASLSDENMLLMRQLSLTTQQLNAAHRVIGRLSAERDMLRQHFADAVGIPVEEVVVATETDPSEPQKKVLVEAKPPSRFAKLNYFGGPDYETMRRRRQTFVAILFGIILMLWVLSRAGYWSMPSNLSRDSLGQMPYIGDLMTYFLAGWLFFRVAKVSSKGIRWVFPSENKRRRR